MPLLFTSLPGLTPASMLLTNPLPGQTGQEDPTEPHARRHPVLSICFPWSDFVFLGKTTAAASQSSKHFLLSPHFISAQASSSVLDITGPWAWRDPVHALKHDSPKGCRCQSAPSHARTSSRIRPQSFAMKPHGSMHHFQI